MTEVPTWSGPDPQISALLFSETALLIPLTMIIKSILSNDEDRRWNAVLMSARVPSQK
jgi:hypothetical protein